MDNVFWYGIAIGSILSLLASIVANLLNNKIQDAIGLGRHGLSSRKKIKLGKVIPSLGTCEAERWIKFRFS